MTTLGFPQSLESRKFRLQQFNPHPGEFAQTTELFIKDRHTLQAPDVGDWVFPLEGTE